jgi:hypothetical protein
VAVLKAVFRRACEIIERHIMSSGGKPESMLIRFARRAGLVGYVRDVAARDTRDALKPAYHSLKKLEGQIAAVQSQLRDVQSALAGFARAIGARRADCPAGEVDPPARRCEQGTTGGARYATRRIRGLSGTCSRQSHQHPSHRPVSPHHRRQTCSPRFLQTAAEGDPAGGVFRDHDPIKQNLRTPIDFGPALSIRVLNFLEEVLARRARSVRR